MLETPVHVRSHERAAETVERHAHILWIDHGSGGHGYLRGDSRAFSPLPVSLAGTNHWGSPDTTPGELLAAAVCSSFVVTLADLLARRDTPALEIAVDATCQLGEGECGQTIIGLHLRVGGRGVGLEPESFAQSAQLALACCPISHALSATVDITVDADLAPGNVMQRADVAAARQTTGRRGSSPWAVGACERGCESR
jgi:organic hydroperoxide reductase OsmC/OhrA